LNKRIIISGGGTGGHVFPAIAIANALKAKDPNIEFLFVGAEGKIEMTKVPDAGYKIIGLPVRGFKRKLSFENISVLLKLWKSLNISKKIIKDFNPDIAIGVGGYASGPVLKQAARAGVITVLQEQNSYAGLTNKLLGKKAVKVFVAYPNMEKFFDAEKIIFTGNPVRQNVLDIEGKQKEAVTQFGLNENCKTIVLVGGSGGSAVLNDAVLHNFDQIAQSQNVQLLWQTGEAYFEKINKQIENKAVINIKAVPFINRMDLAYSIADLVISRAGAGAISELSLIAKPSILVPSPFVAEDHQTKNAMSLVNENAAVMVHNSEVKEKLFSTAFDLIENEQRMQMLSQNIRKFAVENSADKIAEEILKLIQ